MLGANVIATSGRAVEAAGDVDVLLLDKTGTITLGNRLASAFLPAEGVEEKNPCRCRPASSLADETPEGRSIVVLAKQRFNLRERDLQSLHATFVPFTAQTRMSGINIDRRMILQKAPSTPFVAMSRPTAATSRRMSTNRWKMLPVRGDTAGGRGRRTRAGVISLKDIVKGGLRSASLNCGRWALKR